MTDTKTAALVAEIDRLTKELAETKQDAERYRWVRDHCTPEENPSDTWIVEAPGSMWNEAIDAAMLRTDAGAKTG